MLRERMGTAARDRVRRDFLRPRLALDYLKAGRKPQPALNDKGINKFVELVTVC